MHRASNVLQDIMRRLLYNMTDSKGPRLAKKIIALVAVLTAIIIVYGYGHRAFTHGIAGVKLADSITADGPHQSAKQRHKTHLKMILKGSVTKVDAKKDFLHNETKLVGVDVADDAKPTIDLELYEDVDDVNDSKQIEKSGGSSLNKWKVREGMFEKSGRLEPETMETWALWGDVKLIVMYPVSEALGEEKDIECGTYRCSFTFNNAALEAADAVMVDGYLLSQTKNRIEPVRSSPEQAWIFYSKMPWTTYRHEFPYSWNSVFNWTFTYDRSSEFIGSKAELVHMKSRHIFDWPHIMRLKTKKVLWIVDQCHSNSRREEYVAELQKYIPVDIVGKCGRKCIHGVEDNENELCFQQYMFYLSFEDTLCKDYITDHFFKTFSHHIVPIVRGGTDYERLYPSNLYIDTANFGSPKLLANFLIRLIRNQTEYLGYLHRRVNFVVSKREKPLCKICSYLYRLDRHRNVYSDLARWLDVCTTPRDLYFNRKLDLL